MAIDNGNIVPYHKLIIPGVGMMAGVGDIQQVTGEVSGYLNDLCRSRFINRWAKYKPVPYPYIDIRSQLNADKTWKTGQNGATWWQGITQHNITYMDNGHSGIIESTSCGLTIRMYFGDISHLISDWDTYGWQHFWEYTPPTGGASQPFRESDFNYYCHFSQLAGGEDNDKPFSSFQCPSVIERGGEDSDNDGFIDNYYLIYAPAPAVYMRQVDNPYLLSISDMNVRHGAGSLSLGNYYFGLLAVSGNTIRIVTCKYHFNEDYVSDDGNYRSSMKYRWIDLPDWFTYQMQSGRFYPILSKDKYLTSSDQPNDWGDIGGLDSPIVPLPFDPVDFTQTTKQISIRVDVAIVSRTASSVVVDVTATNVTQLQTFNMNWSNIPYNYTCYSKDSNGAVMYEDPDNMIHQNAGISNTALSLGPGDSDTIRLTFAVSNNYNHGYFFMLRCGIDYGSYIGAAAVTGDYDS